MIDLKLILRFLNRNDVNISIEEFLLLWIVKSYNEESNKQFREELIASTLQYYKTNYSISGLNNLIEKLKKREFLLDYREDKITIDFKSLEVSDEFKKFIWTSDKDEIWERLKDFVFDRCGDSLQIGNTKSISYFFVNQSDPTINSIQKLKDYFWLNICKSGDLHESEKFFYYFETWLGEKDLNMKMSNFLINYHEGTLKKEIESILNKDTKTKSFYKRL